MRTANKSPMPALLLAVLVSALTACATPSQPPRLVQPARQPPPPAELMQPPNCGGCSEAVQELFKSWLKRLTPTPPV